MMDTHRTEKLPIFKDKKVTTSSVQWMLEQEIDPEIFHINNIEVLICGQNAFKKIAEDIQNAQKSIDLICWGFDPAMELEREGDTWPRGKTYGDLLADAAERGVKVRLLCWYDKLVSDTLVNNMPGYSQRGMAKIYEILPKSKKFLRAKEYKNVRVVKNDAYRYHDAVAKDSYSYDWYKDAFSGKYGIEVRVRDADSDTINLTDEEKEELTFLEEKGLQWAATHHQKTILIDYEGESPIGYIMGLNSVTDY